MVMAAFNHIPFSEFGKQIGQPIGCANCHETGTMHIVVTDLTFKEELKKQGLGWTKFTPGGLPSDRPPTSQPPPAPPRLLRSTKNQKLGPR
jgi:hypothetical protein